MGVFFSRHRIRATFYHLVAILFLIVTALYAMSMISEKVSFIMTAILFVADYIAEMYDPHPETPGPWFKRHFHRFYDGK
jgi:hypothetical protein